MARRRRGARGGGAGDAADGRAVPADVEFTAELARAAVAPRWQVRLEKFTGTANERNDLQYTGQDIRFTVQNCASAVVFDVFGNHRMSLYRRPFAALADRLAAWRAEVKALMPTPQPAGGGAQKKGAGRKSNPTVQEES